MYWPRRIFVLVLLWQSCKDSDCVVSQADMGLNDIKEVFGEEQDEFKAFLNWIERNTICLRRGEAADKACYVLSDFLPGPPPDSGIPDMVKTRAALRFVANPYPDEDKCKLWYARLWNSIAFTLNGENLASSPMLLTYAASRENERYTAPIGIGIGIEQKTFSKGTVGGEAIDLISKDKERKEGSKEESKEEQKTGEKGERIGEILQLNRGESLGDLRATVKRVMKWMKSKGDTITTA